MLSYLIFSDPITFPGKMSGGDFLCATVSPQGKWLYCVGEDGVCYVFDAQSGQLESVLQVAVREVRASLPYSDNVADLSAVIIIVVAVVVHVVDHS